MKSLFRGIAASILAAAGLTSCLNVDHRLGESYLATDQKYDIYTTEFALEDIEMVSPDSLSGYSIYRFTVGAVRDPQFGLTTRSAAFTLVPVVDTIDYGKNAKFKSFHFAAPSDSCSCDDLTQLHILQNIHVYELEKELDLSAIDPEIVFSPERITKGVPVYNGTDSLAFNFSDAFGEKYMHITQEDLDDIETYRKHFPGIYITTDAPAGNGGRINMFQVPINVSGGTIYGSYASLRFTADYGTRTQVDTSFIFYIGPLDKYNMAGVTGTSVTQYPQVAFDLATHETKHLEGKAGETIWFEGGRGLKPVVKAASIKEKLSRLVAQHGDVSDVVVSKATIEMPFEFPEDYQDIRLFPATLSPTCRIVTDTSVTFAGITDASISSENQGTINRSTCMYAPDLSHHIQSLLRLKDDSKIENYDIWFLGMANEVVSSGSSTTAADQEMADYYQQLAYASYYNSIYGYNGYGGYGGYGYGGYGGYGYGGYSNYYNYYNLMMMSSLFSGSGSSSTSTQSIMDFHRFYRAKLNGPVSANGPRLRVTYAVPAAE